MLRKFIIRFLFVSLTFLIFYFLSFKFDLNPFYKVGDEIDKFNGISVFYNGGINNVEGRQVSKDGYNIGLKFQCVEFVKRYYFQVFNHKMNNSYGHAKDFFDKKIKDNQFNNDRGLKQFTNPSGSKPKIHDIVIFNNTIFNPFGHVAIISKVEENEVEIIQQNKGSFGNSRERLNLKYKNSIWKIDNKEILGWLRKE